PNAKEQQNTNKCVDGTGYQISTKTLRPGTVQKVRAALEGKFGVRNFSSTSIGPTFGKTIAPRAIIALIASLLVISAYIALRFEWKYAIPVLIALMHDLLITAGVYSLTGREVTTATVAALLTILGYSLYDTIIVFDRVRENVPRMLRAAFSQIVNRPMSEVLPRSLATRCCTLIAPEEAGQRISHDEFQELVQDLDIEETPGRAGRGPAGTQVARRPVVAEPDVRPEEPAEQVAPARDPAADLAPEDLVLKDTPKPRPKRRASGGKRRKHGRSR